VQITCIYSKKTTFSCQKCTTPAYSQKKIESFDSEQSPNLHILKKIKKNKDLRLYVGVTGVDDLDFDFFDVFEYMQVLQLFPIKMFDFFEYMQV